MSLGRGLGPWLYDSTGAEIGFDATVTKTMRHGGSLSWCHDTIRDGFSQLFPVMYSSFRDANRADALQTAFHWLIESEQCAGGVEGAIILQQAALECLAWHEIVQQRSLCSESGFKPLPANDKIRWLLSLHRISVRIPDKSESITPYAKAFNLVDMVDVLVDVRNTLIHAEPKRAARLFGRDAGDEERGDLWYQIGGVLQQALLASLAEAPEGSEFVITRYRDANANLRTQFHRIVRKAGLEPWQKPFQNLRSTRETELAETYPMHVVCAWIGNSESVAAKHYLQVTDEHFERATKPTQNPTISGAISSNQEPSGETEKCGNAAESEENPVLVSLPSSPGRTRTYDKPVNSRLLYQLSYRGMNELS